MRTNIFRKTLASALLASAALTLAGCGGMASNPSLESIHQPVVSQTNYTLDVSAGPGGISIPEQRRLAGWFEAMDLRYGDRVSIDDPSRNPANRSAVEAVASRHSMLVGDEAPVTPGYVNPGTVRIVVTRTVATVPGCPDWSAKSETNLRNATSTNYGCATNSNLASMVADPSHLINGATGSGSTTVTTGTKAIESYRNRPPTGDQGLKEQSSKGN
ncbi:MAG: CpaD family pilus assembly protein [Novosphingobium sp.]|uniref:CpaD family pilus assembly protein n=1 Tax=Novosphingobium sp. TaxID=1874826 RepID=UPI0032BE2C48